MFVSLSKKNKHICNVIVQHPTTMITTSNNYYHYNIQQLSLLQHPTTIITIPNLNTKLQYFQYCYNAITILNCDIFNATATQHKHHHTHTYTQTSPHANFCTSHAYPHHHMPTYTHHTPPHKHHITTLVPLEMRS